MSPLRPGDPDRIGPYRITGRLGEGGQGSVFHAADEQGGAVAVKLLHARFSGDAKARSRFAAELAVAQRVAPFCTARILDADVEGRTPYIVSEFIDGPSLAAVLATEGPRSGQALVRLAIGTMTALAAIHDGGVVHRDFKPSNVLMAPDGPRVIDFGIAKALDATGTLSSTAVGTPAYMAPEQISGARVGPEADVFAWGAAMVFAATGRAPFGQDSIPAVMHRILNLPPDVGALDGPLRDIVAQCLIKNPAQRPTAHHVLLRLLGLAGALPPAPDAQPAAMLTQGAEMAAAPTPPSVPGIPESNPAGNLAGNLAGNPAGNPAGMAAPPPPGPPPVTWPPPVAYGTDPGSSRPGGRRGIGVLAGVGAAVVVALILVGSVVAVQLLKDDGKKGGTGGTTGGGRIGGEFRMMTAPPNTLDPSSGSWRSPDRSIVKQLFTGLAEVTPQGNLQNKLASSIEADPSCRVWTIRLRPGTTFSNGEPVDGNALIRAWSRAVQAKDSLGATFMADITGYFDAHSGKAFTGLKPLADGVQVELTAPNCEFGKRLADPIFSPVPAAAGKPDNAAYNDKPVGNGPFMIESYVKNQRLVLVRNPNWAFGRTKLDRVTIELSSDAAAKSTTAIAAGSLDWAEVNTDSAPTVARDNGPARLLTRPSTSTNFLVPMTAKGPMAKKEARLAVSYALNRKELSGAYSGGLYPPSTGLVPAAVPGFNRTGICPSCETYDPEKAKTLAAQAGLKPGTAVPMLVYQGSTYERWAELVKGQLTKVLGLKIDINKVADFSARSKALADKNTIGLVPLGWFPDYPSAYNFLQPLLSTDQHPPRGSNYSRWSNAQFDAAIKIGAEKRDPQEALTALRQAEQIALDDMALIPVWNQANVRLAGQGFVNLEMDFEGDPTLATAARK